MVYVSITPNTGNIGLVVPFWRRPFLFNLGEDAFSLVVCAVCARRQLAITLDLLSSTLITGLEKVHKEIRSASHTKSGGGVEASVTQISDIALADI